MTRSTRLCRIALAVGSILLLVPTLGAATSAENGDPAAPQAPLDALAAFEALKSLEGTWTGTVTRGQSTRQTKIVYEVSAAGHSLIQTFAPGTDVEMFSVYHLDGDQLLMTHYCALGNAPKMRFVSSDTPGSIRFEFAGGTNLDPTVDAHAHEGRMQLIDDNTYESVSVGWAGGRPAGEQLFRMTRQQ